MMDLSPQRASYSSILAGDAIKKSPRWDDNQGVAATVGTIMALLVFLSFFGIFTNQFVPVWMSDNESSHMSEAIQQFSSLKSQIDGLIADYANSVLAPPTVFVPVTLSASGIPVFAAPTAGILTFSPDSQNGQPSFNVTYRYVSNTTTPASLVLDSSNDGHSGGNLDLYCPNRYYVEQHLIYENGAVIVNQTEGEFIVAGIQMSVTNYASAGTTSRVLKLTQVSLVGLNKTVGGTGSKGVSAELLYADTRAYQNSSGSGVDLTLVTQHSVAWVSYFGKVLNASLAGLTYGTDFTITKTLINDLPGEADDYYQVVVTINGVKVFNHARAMVQLSVGELGV